MYRSLSKRQKKAPIPVFLSVFMIVSGCLFFIADSVGFVPYYIDGTAPLSTKDATALASSRDLALSALPQLGVSGGSADAALAAAAQQARQKAAASEPIYPVHIAISSVGIRLPVQNPSTTNVDALDALLKHGPARYAKSATLGVAGGNVIIFAHSSHLPIVINKMFQAFNQIPDTTPGDIVTLTGTDGKSYLYRVLGVVKATTTDGTTIPLQPEGTELTLVTCDTLSGVSHRFILTAAYIGVD